MPTGVEEHIGVLLCCDPYPPSCWHYLTKHPPLSHLRVHAHGGGVDQHIARHRPAGKVCQAARLGGGIQLRAGRQEGGRSRLEGRAGGYSRGGWAAGARHRCGAPAPRRNLWPSRYPLQTSCPALPKGTAPWLACAARAAALSTLRFAITTCAPLTAAPKASARPAPPAPTTTTFLPARGEEAASVAAGAAACAHKEGAGGGRVAIQACQMLFR